MNQARGGIEPQTAGKNTHYGQTAAGKGIHSNLLNPQANNAKKLKKSKEKEGIREFLGKLTEDNSKNKEDLVVNKTGLVKSLAEKAAITQKDAAKVLDAVLDSIKGALADGDKVQIIGFGTFEVRDRKARKVISPATGKEIKVPATKVPAFKPGKSLKEVVTGTKADKKAKAGKAAKGAKPAKKK